MNLIRQSSVTDDEFNLISLEMMLKQAWCLVLSLVLVCEGNIESLNGNSSKLISHALFNNLLESETSVNIITSVDKISEDVADDFIKNIFQDSLTTLLTSFSLNSNATSGINLMVIDSFDNFKIISSFINNKKAHVIILIAGKAPGLLYGIFKISRDKNISNINIMYEEEGSVKFASYKLFSERSCNDAMPIIAGNLTKADFTNSRIKNFYQCPLTVGALLNMPYAMCESSSCAETLHGRDVFIMKELSKALNFSVIFRPLQVQEVNEAVSLVKNKYLDVIIGDYYLRHDRVQIIDCSVSYFASELAFVVPRGRPFTSIESIMKSFSSTVWILLLIVMLIAVCVIIVIKFQSDVIKDFVYGRNVNNPTENLMAIVFGISLNRLPAMNFARFILMSFVMFCLVMRTLYQGSFYRLLQSDMAHKMVQSIDDMVEQGFTFYIYESNVKMVVDDRIAKSMVKGVSVAGQDETIERLKDPSFQGTFIKSRAILMYKILINTYNYEINICRDPLVYTPSAFYFQKNSFLTETFNEKLLQLMNAGLIEYWHNLFVKGGQKAKSNGPKILTMKHLIGIFQILGLGLISSAFLFILECLKLKCQ